jgi:GntR family galactonate operon transcriptional repressor
MIWQEVLLRKSRMRKLNARGLHEQVIEEIGKRIVQGEYPPGESLPGEPGLCELLGVSRTALREGLRVLASKGLVEPKRKVGTLVRPTVQWNFLDSDVLAWLLDGGDSEKVISELYELRHLIEPLAASLAAKHAQKADVERLKVAYEEMEAAGDDGERIEAPDLRFHETIIMASGNRLFSSLAHVISAALQVNFKFVRHAPSGHPYTMPAHKKVLEAIAAANASAARVAMQELVELSQEEARRVNRAQTRKSKQTPVRAESPIRRARRR